MSRDVVTFMMRVQFTGHLAVDIDGTPSGRPPSQAVDNALRSAMTQLYMTSALPKKSQVWAASTNVARGIVEMRWESAVEGPLMMVFVNGFQMLHRKPESLDPHRIRSMLLYKFKYAGITSIPKFYRPYFAAYNSEGPPPDARAPLFHNPFLPPYSPASHPRAPSSRPLPSPSIVPALGAHSISIDSPPPEPVDLDALAEDQLADQPASALAAELARCRAARDRYQGAVKRADARSLDLAASVDRFRSENKQLAAENAIMRREMQALQVQALRDLPARDEGASVQDTDASSSKRKREDDEVLQRLVRLRDDDAQVKTEPGGDADILHAVSATESYVRGLRVNLQGEGSVRRAAERRLKDVERECKEPFVVPALLQAFLQLSKLGEQEEQAAKTSLRFGE